MEALCLCCRYILVFYLTHILLFLNLQHARRLFPLQLSTKDKIEWAYWDAEGDDWVIVDKSLLDDSIPDGLEKMIGFEGRPDPASGYYCKYNGGKLVTDNGDDPMQKSSNKLR